MKYLADLQLTAAFAATSVGSAAVAQGAHPKSTTDFVAALQSVTAIEGSKNPLSRNFQGRSIFDFCNMGNSGIEPHKGGPYFGGCKSP